MTVSCQEERFVDFAIDVRALVDEHWQEAGSFKDEFKRRINYMRYIKMDAAELLLSVTARRDGELCGYMIGVLGEDFHRVTEDGVPVLVASVLVYYMRPAERGYARSLALAYERAAEAAGCLILNQRVKRGINRADAFFAALGYIETEVGMAKLIGAARVRPDASKSP